jgi:hypothetical protein
VFSAKGRHFVGNARADDGGDSGVADAKPEQIRPVAILARTACIVTVTMCTTLDEQLPSMRGGYRPSRRGRSGAGCVARRNIAEPEGTQDGTPGDEAGED